MITAQQILASGAVFEISASHKDAGAYAGWIMRNGGMARISFVPDAKIFAWFEDDGEPLENEYLKIVWEAFCNA